MHVLASECRRAEPARRGFAAGDGQPGRTGADRPGRGRCANQLQMANGAAANYVGGNYLTGLTNHGATTEPALGGQLRAATGRR
jgi:hypothetical protein